MSEASQIPDLVAEALGILEEEGEAAYETFLAQHPEHTVVIRARVSSLRDAGLVEPDSPAEVPEVLGEFVLGDKIGSGGMGMVFRANQPSLRREVAVKVVRPELLFFPGSRERFRREVEAIARLQHGGLIGIYAVGEERGLPFYAMELVRGMSLNALVERLRLQGKRPTKGEQALDLIRSHADADSQSGDGLPSFFVGSWSEFCCRSMQQVAEALQHAHEHGVLHRDIKPSNVMLTPTGRVVVLDFGLAAAEGSDELTRSGAQLGSLPYMAPEQVEGRSAEFGPHTDVYGMGVTLFELLCRRPAFGPQADGELRQRILHGEADGMDSHWAGRDVALVCAKAMDQDPLRRYASAQDFADDLGRVLRHEPILAKPPGLALRLRRFARRRPVTATLIAVLLLGAVAGPLIYRELDRRHQAQIAKVEREEQVERQRRREQLEAAIQGVGRLTRSVTEVEDLSALQHDTLMENSLKEALRIYERLSTAGDADQRLPLERARTYVQLGRLLRKLSRSEEALVVLTKAAELFDQHFAARRGEGVEVQRPIMVEARKCDLQLSWVLRENNQLQAATTRAERALRQLLSLRPLDVKEVAGEAALRRFLGVNYLQLGEIKQAETHLAKALFHLHAHFSSKGKEFSWYHEYSSCAQLLAVIYVNQDRHDRAEKLFASALQFQRIIVRLVPKSTASRIALGFRHRGMGYFYLQQRRFAEAATQFRAAIKQRDALLAQDLNRPRIGISRCDDQGLLARALWFLGERDAARKELDAASAAARNICAAHADNLEFQGTEARLLGLAGEFAFLHRDARRSRDLLETAHNKQLVIEKQGELDPETVRSHGRVQVLLGLAELLCETGDRASRYLRRGFARLRGLQDARQQDATLKEIRDLTLYWVVLLCERDELDAALELLRMGVMRDELQTQELRVHPGLGALADQPGFKRLVGG